MKLRFVKTESQIRLVDDSDNGKCIMVEYWPWTAEQEWCYRKLAEVERKRKAVEASRRWQAKNPEMKKVYDKTYRDKHKEKRKEWNQLNKDKCREYSKRSRNKRALLGV